MKTRFAIKKAAALASGGGDPEILLPNLVYAIARLGLRGLDLEAVLLGGGREEAPDRMFLPIRSFSDLDQDRSLGPPDQFQDLCAPCHPQSKRWVGGRSGHGVNPHRWENAPGRGY